MTTTFAQLSLLRNELTTVTVFENQHSIHSFDGKNRSNRIFKNIFTRKSFRVRQKEVGLLFGLASSTAKKSVVLRIIQLTTFNLQAKIAVEIRINNNSLSSNVKLIANFQILYNLYQSTSFNAYLFLHQSEADP